MQATHSHGRGSYAFPGGPVTQPLVATLLLALALAASTALILPVAPGFFLLGFAVGFMARNGR